MTIGQTEAHAHEARSSCRLGAEPSLQELLDDPVMEAMMRRDGVDRGALINLLAEVGARLRQRRYRREQRELCAAACD